jgi:hypothetical protein
MNHFVQAINVPDIIFGNVGIITPFVKLPIPGDQLQFGELNISFRVDEDMRSYTEIYDWLIALGYPDNFDQFKTVAPTRDPLASPSSLGTYSDATLTILSSSMNPIIEVTFFDMFPINLTGLAFDTKMMDVEYIECTASMVYKRFAVTRL